MCTVEGPRDNINRCLQMLRRRFPANRFPELNLEPVLPPPIPSPAAELFGTQPTQVVFIVFFCLYMNEASFMSVSLFCIEEVSFCGGQVSCMSYSLSAF